ncbi:MAG TPA: 16S rRNA (cytosine(1402)-N(4))-methyltransferase RsmH [Tepidisphaeraceae bacterium]|nr:16S rRNA (cytosine(1402)-N(4))-methyltransferase RsmH [Tepidisphaeraceae bacterium]
MIVRLGGGGHSGAIGKAIGEEGLLIGLDVDPRNLEFADQRLADVPCRRRLFHASFAELDEVLSQAGIDQVDGILADLGVSTNQLFDEAYGLSFSAPMPLDMRLDPRIKRTAADLINRMAEAELADLLFGLAQEKASYKIARKIVAERKRVPITTTDQLAQIVRSAIGRSHEKIDPATRTFLALRMAVNDEMNNLRVLVERGPAMLKPGGRMAVISFQSMEDRLVKQGFKIWQDRGEVTILTKKPIEASEDEVAKNARSRSAKMRIIEKLNH